MATLRTLDPVSRAFHTILLVLLSVLAISASGAAGHANTRHNDLVKAELLVEPSAIQPGQPFTVALRLRMKQHWHTYWRNPGDSGLPTEIRWSLPPGFSAGPIQWPTPERLPVGPLMNFGYEGEAILLTQITPPANLVPTGRQTLKADASWLVCEKECIPGSASLAVSAPAAPAATSVPPDATYAAAFAAARASMPTPLAGAAFSLGKQSFTVSVPLPSGVSPEAVTAAAFFPVAESLLENAAAQKRDIQNNTLTLTLQRDPHSDVNPEHLEGVLTLATADRLTRGYAITIGTPPVASLVPTNSHPALVAAVSAAAITAASQTSNITLFSAIILAFAGGIFLNLMPCVFPVLSIKVLSLTRGAGKTPRAMRLHGLSYGAGVLLSFATLAAILVAARQAGASVGWGFQLQSPPVVALLAYVMFAMGLGLSGAIQLGAAFSGVGDRLTRHSGYAGSFFTGVLASVVASPCTGPFMGAAIGFSLTQSAAVAIAVFVALGAGLAFPFVLLTFLPALLRRMPRPGRWMEVLKQALAFPLYATATWLVWVLSQQVGPDGLFAALLGLLAVAAAAWLAGLASTSRRGGAIAARLCLLAALAFAGSVLWRLDAAPGAIAAQMGDGMEPFTQARLATLRAEGRPVFVNMTAAWCITCMVNERTSLASAAVKEALARKGVVYLKGDWTNQNPEITEVLQRFGRGGVPLYLFYAGGTAQEPVVLPQILTPTLVLEALSAAPDKAVSAAAKL